MNSDFVSFIDEMFSSDMADLDFLDAISSFDNKGHSKVVVLLIIFSFIIFSCSFLASFLLSGTRLSNSLLMMR